MPMIEAKVTNSLPAEKETFSQLSSEKQSA